MRILIKQLKKNYDFEFPVTYDITEGEDGITATWDEPLKVSGELTIIDGQRAEINFHIVGQVEYPCSRCLEPVKTDVDYSFDEVIYDIEGDQVDITEYVADCLYINEPHRILCKEDCKGLCPVCGKNLNFETCDCQEQEADFIDPRLEELKNLLV